MRQKLPKGTHSMIRDINKNSVLNIIREFGPISRTDIALKLDSSIPTVMRAVDALLSDEMITYTGVGASNGGRKPPLLEINPLGGYVFGAHIGSFLEIVLSNLKADIIDSASFPTGMSMEPEAVIGQISSVIDKMLIKNNIPESKVFGVGIGTPGVNFRTNTKIGASVFKGWDNINLEELVKKYIRFKTFTENVSYTAMLREYWFGKTKGYDDIIYLWIDKGIGGGIILNGEPYKGINMKAGELGHISVEYEGNECYCGNKGCIETYASIPAITEKVKAYIRDGFESSLAEIQSGDADISFEDICREAENGDNLSANVIKDAGRRLGTVIANLANIFDPELVVLSGGAIKHSPLLFETSRTEALERVFSYRDISKKLEIVNANTEIANSLGCVALVFQSVFTHGE